MQATSQLCYSYIDHTILNNLNYFHKFHQKQKNENESLLSTCLTNSKDWDGQRKNRKQTLLKMLINYAL